MALALTLAVRAKKAEASAASEAVKTAAQTALASNGAALTATEEYVSVLEAASAAAKVDVESGQPSADKQARLKQCQVAEYAEKVVLAKLRVDIIGGEVSVKEFEVAELKAKRDSVDKAATAILNSNVNEQQKQNARDQLTEVQGKVGLEELNLAHLKEQQVEARKALTAAQEAHNEVKPKAVLLKRVFSRKRK